MSDEFSNDNAEFAGPTAAREPDAHGQAALFLVESLIHVLIERSVISVASAADAIETAIEVKHDIGLQLGDSPATLAKSLKLLEAISASIQRDLPPREDRP